jgi:hypothetical protein
MRAWVLLVVTLAASASAASGRGAAGRLLDPQEANRVRLLRERESAGGSPALVAGARGNAGRHALMTANIILTKSSAKLLDFVLARLGGRGWRRPRYRDDPARHADTTDRPRNDARHGVLHGTLHAVVYEPRSAGDSSRLHQPGRRSFSFDVPPPVGAMLSSAPVAPAAARAA